MKLTTEQVRARFKERGLKVTPQRTAIYQALVETTGHPTAEEVYRQVKRLYPMISTNTVYYSLAALRDAGLVQEVNAWRDRGRYDANVAQHHHLVCLGCRRIQDVMDEALNNVMVAPDRVTSRFEIIGHRVEFYGYCSTCRRRNLRGNRF